MVRIEPSTSAVARVFTTQPDRIAAAWHRILGADGYVNDNGPHALEDVVEGFILALGRMLSGKPGSAWAFTTGVLKLTPELGVAPLAREFHALDRCLSDVLEVLRASVNERLLCEQAFFEAQASAHAYLQRLLDANAKPPQILFGGVVVERFERTPPTFIRNDDETRTLFEPTERQWP